MEKERYEFFSTYEGKNYLFDRNANKDRSRRIDDIDMTALLNQQDLKIKKLESQVEKWKQDYENCSKLEKNMTKEHQYCLDNWRACEQENYQLKEKIKQLKFDCAMYKSANYLINEYGIEKAREIMFQSEKKLKQSQNEKTIEVLTKVKKTLKDYKYNHCFLRTEIDICNNAIEIVDNKIKELRSEK